MIAGNGVWWHKQEKVASRETRLTLSPTTPKAWALIFPPAISASCKNIVRSWFVRVTVSLLIVTLPKTLRV
jgi:hypothetical protein